MTPRKQQRERALFHTYNLDDLVPENHILRKIDRMIDFSFVREVVWDCYCHTNGRPGTDPELIVRMILIGYLYGLSENRLSDEVRMHAAYRLFCHMDSFDETVPDRSTINKLRNVKWAGKEVFKTIMRRIVKECVAAGLVKGTHMSVDGTQIHADASVKSIEPITPPISLDAYLNTLGLDENAPSVTPAASDTPPAPSAPAGRHSEDKDFHGEKWTNDTHRSTTDPEAMLCKKSKGKSAELSYFGHELIDTRSRVILDILATQATGTAEREAALNMLDAVEALKLPGSPKFLVADTKYGSGDFLADLLDRDIIPHIPLLSSPQVEPIPCWKRKTNNPELQAKRDQKVREAKARNAARFLAHTKAYLQSQALRKRSEHSFAEGKQLHGLGRARYRGLSALQDQLYGIASVQNLKRLASFRNRKKAASGSAAGVSIPPIATPLPTGEHYSRRNAELSSVSPFLSVMRVWKRTFCALNALSGKIKPFLFPIPFSIPVSVRFPCPFPEIGFFT
jgi:transposase